MPIIIPNKVNPLVLSYPDFTLNAIINPDEFDQNNLDIQDKLNEFIIVENTTIDNTVIINDNTNLAVTQSTTALGLANTASTNATSAVGVANTAFEMATTAEAVSINAMETANNAQTVALDVQGEFNAIKPELEQAVADVADKASVAYVDQIAADFVLGEVVPDSITREMFAPEIRVELDSIRTDVDDVTNYAYSAIPQIQAELPTFASLQELNQLSMDKISRIGDTMTGALKVQRESDIVAIHDVLHKYFATGNVGTLKITMPKSWSSTMISGKILGSTTTDDKSWELNFSGFNFIDTPAWFYTTAKLNGNSPFSKVRFAHDGSKCCLLLGATDTAWGYLGVALLDLLITFNNRDGWETGWSASIITSEAGLTNIVEAKMQSSFNGFFGTANVLSGAWSATGGYTDYPAHVTISNAQILATDKVDVVFPANYLLVAKTAGVEPVEALAGGFKMYAKVPPLSTLSLEYEVKRGM